MNTNCIKCLILNRLESNSGIVLQWQIDLLDQQMGKFFTHFFVVQHCFCHQSRKK